jgi:tRNA (Thr-GGU) A37 N-methylase
MLQMEKFMFRPIGYLESALKDHANGQIKNSRAKITLVGEINASCLEGLEDYGFMWLIYINDKGLPKDKKVAVEVNLDGKFCERDIDKCYNPIGLSLAKIIRV